MREILFRGKRADNGDWVYGFYVHLYDHKGQESHRICTGYAEADCGDFYPAWFEVDPVTVGRCTGLTDKNGVSIFEGDILHFINTYKGMNKEWLCTVEFVAPDIVCRNVKKDGEIGCYNHFAIWNYPVVNWDVIGNIHDNPELLEGGAV